MNVLLHGVDQFTAGVAVNGAELTVKGFELNLCSEVIAVLSSSIRTGVGGRKRFSCSCFGACASTTYTSSTNSVPTGNALFSTMKWCCCRCRQRGSDPDHYGLTDAPGNKLCVFTRQGDIALERNGAAIFRQSREIWHQHMIGRRQHDQIVTTVILINTNDIKQIHGEGDQAGIIVLFFNTLSQRQRFFTAVRVDLQQTIATLFQLCFQRVMLFATGFDQIVKAIGIFWFSR